MAQRPSIGRIAHYVSYGTPGGEYTSQCRAAIITEVKDDHTVSLCVLNPTGQFFNQDLPYHDGAEVAGDPDCPEREHHADGPLRYCACGWMEASCAGGSWHWPERVD